MVIPEKIRADSQNGTGHDSGAMPRWRSLLAEARDAVPVGGGSVRSKRRDSCEQGARRSVVGMELQAAPQSFLGRGPVTVAIGLEAFGIEIAQLEHPAFDHTNRPQQLEDPDGLGLADDDHDVEL